MEPQIALEGAQFILSHEKNIRIGEICGDGDAKVMLLLNENLGNDNTILKTHDPNHLCVNLYKSLLKIKSMFKGSNLSMKAILAIKKAYSIEIRRSNSVLEKQRNILNISTHYFNINHSKCGDWCKEGELPSFKFWLEG
jgi:hypothetical protein